LSTGVALVNAYEVKADVVNVHYGGNVPKYGRLSRPTFGQLSGAL